MRYLVSLLSVFLVLAFLVTPSVAEQKVGHFWAEIGGSSTNWNDPFTGGGDGYTSSGPWYEYTSETPQQDPWGGQDPTPVWINQWWYNDPYDPLRWKIVTLDFNYALADPEANGGGNIAINWTTDYWTSESAPPMSNRDGAGNLLIGRQDIDPDKDEFWLAAGDVTVYNFTQTYDLRDFGVDYNPVWISIDVSGYNLLLSSPTVPGSIIHECVPEPSALVLMLAGAGMILAVRFLRRRI